MLGESKKVIKEMTATWKEIFYQQYCPGTNYVTSTTQFASFQKPCYLKLIILKGNVAQVENIAKRGSLKSLHLTPLEGNPNVCDREVFQSKMLQAYTKYLSC